MNALVSSKSLDDLLAKDDLDFVKACYWEVLGREPDAGGLKHHLRLLKDGRSKLTVLVGLADSEEACVKNTAASPLAMRAREQAFVNRGGLRWLRRTAPARSFHERQVRQKLVKKAQAIGALETALTALRGSAEVAPAVVVSQIPKTKWSTPTRKTANDEAGVATLWIDLTTALEWTGGVEGVIRAELELARSLAKANPGVRFSMQIGHGFVEIAPSELTWLLADGDLVEAYTAFFGRGRHRRELPRAVRVQAPDTKDFFYPYGARDLVLAAGWMDSQKEVYFSQLKRELPDVYLCYLVYDVAMLSRQGHKFYDKIGGEEFKAYLKWISHNCDFILYGGGLAQRETETLQKVEGWPTTPGHAITLGVTAASPANQDDKGLLDALDVSGPFIMAVGSLEPRRNNETLYRAYLMAMELTDRPLPQLFICDSPGGHASDLADTLGRDPRIVGRVVHVTPTAEELSALYRNCDFTLSPSPYETWDSTLMQSLAYSKFCISADSLWLREIGDNFVDYVDPYDVRGWAEKIVSYAKEPRRRIDRQAYIAGARRQTSWQDTAEAVTSYLHEVTETTPPQAARIVGFHQQAKPKPPTIWMDMTLSYLHWTGGVNGIVRAELTFAKVLKDVAPGTRYFAYQNGYFFEIMLDYLTWLHQNDDLSVAYEFFHDFWKKHEEAGTGNRNPFFSDGVPSASHPAYLGSFPGNSIVFFAGIDFGDFDENGKPILYRNADVMKLIPKGQAIMTSQLIYDFTPILVPHLHKPETCEGYEPFVDYVSNNFDHIIYGGRTAQRDGLALQQSRDWLSPPSDFVEFGSDITTAPASKTADEKSASQVKVQGKGAASAPKTAAEKEAEKDKKILKSLSVKSDFVITVGTIQPRKNHEVLYKAYLAMIENCSLERPLQLLFIGESGWKSDDLLKAIKSDDRVKDKILLLTPTDEELDVLYRHCLFTLLPSFYEGWSLTLPESLSYGKLCLTADVDPLRETGGDLVEYIHPLDTVAWADRMAFYANSAAERATWEARIKSDWKPLSWRQSAKMLVDALYGAHRRRFQQELDKR